MCDSTISSTSSNVTRPYQTASGYTTIFGTVLALIEAAGLIGAHFPFQSSSRQLFLERLLQLRLAAGIAAGPRSPSRPPVAADKDVLFELRHKTKCIGFGEFDAGAASGRWLLVSSRTPWELRNEQEIEQSEARSQNRPQSFSGTIFLSPWQKVATRCSPPSACGISLTGPKQ